MKITDALLGEHGAFYAQFDRLEETIPHTTSVGEVREQAALLAAALVSHAQLEDTLLFERMRGAGADEGLLSTMESEHTEIAGLLTRAQGTSDAAMAREALLDAVSLARDHFAKEEQVAFPMAESIVGEAGLAALGARWSARREVFLSDS
ncbi:MAG: hemerythrin domain-containing protein [Gemmatimonadales bacterium]|nr:MAG: hemerythrin domain-containing protein [Gemmatimonadales bacterium]